MLDHYRTPFSCTPLLCILATLSLCWGNAAKAQNIELDGTTGTQRPLSGPDYTIRQTDGRTVGQHLFQSFSNFSLDPGESATFESAGNIRTIFSRVTGLQSSKVEGLIKTQSPNVNLFFINPRGISFGQDAGLEVGGSFIASTANSIVFSRNDRPFSAIETQNIPRLNISTPVGLQMGAKPAPISNISTRGVPVFIPGLPIPIFLPFGLEVSSGNTLALLGGRVKIEDGGLLTAPGGRIEVGSVANDFVGLTPALYGWSFDYSGVRNFRDITFDRNVSISTPSPSMDVSSGVIRLKGRNILLQNNSRISSLGADGVGGGLISIDAQRLTLKEKSDVSTNNFGNSSSESGGVSIVADIVILDDFSSLQAQQLGAGPGGNINISGTKLLLLLNNSRISTNASGFSEGGNINIDSDIIFAPPNANGDITANAENGPGGQIAITTQGVFGLAVRDELTDFSDITAISINDPSLNGRVTINTPGTDPSDSTAELSEKIAIPPKLAQGCRAGQALGNGQFANVGRGGLPDGPTTVRSVPAVWDDMRPPQELQQASSALDRLILPSAEAPASSIVEAKGWKMTPQGMMLVGPEQTPSTIALAPVGGC
ncbi:MAG: filamentous hemagglutinin N-terminal domain-containing protein [Thermosynechococcaceae cyanobacterium]